MPTRRPTGLRAARMLAALARPLPRVVCAWQPCVKVTKWARLVRTLASPLLLVSYWPLASKGRVAHRNTRFRRLIDVSAKNNGYEASTICKTKPWQPLGAAQKAPGRQPRGRRRLRRNRKRIGPGRPRAAGQPLDAHSRVAAALVWPTGSSHVQRPGAQSGQGQG